MTSERGGHCGFLFYFVSNDEPNLTGRCCIGGAPTHNKTQSERALFLGRWRDAEGSQLINEEMSYLTRWECHFHADVVDDFLSIGRPKYYK